MPRGPSFFLTVFIVLFAVLPLDFLKNFFFLQRVAWNGWMFASLVLLVGFYFFTVFFAALRLNTHLVLFSLTLTLLLVSVSGTAAYGFRVGVLLHLLTLTWFLPLVDWLRTVFGRETLLALAVLVLALHAQWGIGHFIVQHDFGLSYLGEARLSPVSIGIAKFPFSDHKLLRSYGPYTHANDFGGSLAIGILLTFLLFSSRRTVSFRRLLFILLFILILGVLLSFSRAAYVSVFLAFVIALFWILRYERSLLSSYLIRSFLFTLCILLVFISFFLVTRFTDPDDVAVSERLLGYTWGFALALQQPWWQGVGLGMSPIALQHYLQEQHISYASWQIDYVHSVPLLLVLEWGFLAGVGAAITLVVLAGRRLFLLLPLAPLLLFDHYLLTQFAPALWVVFLLLVVRAFPLRQVLPSVLIR